jgi:hypothetical protein
LFVLIVSDRYCLDDSLLKKFQDYEEKTLSSSKWEARKVALDHIDPMCYLFLSSSHIGLHDLILVPKPHTVGIWVSYFISYA